MPGNCRPSIIEKTLYHVRNSNDLSETDKKCIKSALEKQIPKKPTGLSVNEDNMRIGNCSCCKTLVSDLYDKHHCLCGQALDWS